MPEHVETRSLFNPEKPGVEQVGNRLFHLQTPLASVAFVARSSPRPIPEGEGRNREETRDKALRTSAWEAKTPQVLVRLAIF